MATRAGTSVIVAMTFCAALLPLSEASAQARDSVDLVRRVDSLFKRYAGDSTPGCAVGINVDGKALLRRGYGMASLEYSRPIEPRTVFNAASVAKQFTAAAILELAQAGKLSLKDDVRRFIPELPRYETPILIEHLIHHTSGLRDQWELMWLAGGRDDDPTEFDDLLPMITRQKGLNFRPGTQFLYSNTGYTLLALVVQRVSGQTLREYAAQRVFAPQGLTSTSFVDSRFDVNSAATGYRLVRGGKWGRAAYLYDVYGAGGVFTTVGDLLTWYDKLLEGNATGSAFAQKAFDRPRLSSGDSILYTFGLETGTYRGQPFAGHGGNDMGANAYAFVVPGRGVGVAVLCNGREIDAYTFARQTAGFVIPPVASPLPTATTTNTLPLTANAPAVDAFAGLYYNPTTLATRRVRASDGVLFWVRGGPGTPLDRVADNKFRFPPGQPAELVFPPREKGKVQTMQLLSGGSVTPYERATPFEAPLGGIKVYSGNYRSEELDVTLRLAARDSTIDVNAGGSWSFRAQPVFRDAFAVADVIVLQFTRDAGGQITGFIAVMPRAKGMRFVRQREQR